MDQGQWKYLWAHIKKSEEDKSVTQHAKVLHYYRGLKALHNSTIQPTHHIYCTLVSLQSCSSSLWSWKTQFWQVAPILFSLARCRNLVPLREGTMGYFSPSCVLYVGDNIQQRTWLICRGGSLAQLPPHSCIYLEQLATLGLFLWSIGPLSESIQW